MIKSALLIALLASCAVDELSTETQDILGGTLTGARPEVGKYVPIGNDLTPCAATLISPTTFLTSAACIGYAPLFAGQSEIAWENYTASYPTRAFSIGMQGGGVGKDLAVGELFAPSTFTPAAIAYLEPSRSQTVTEIGYGCTEGTGDSCTSGTDARTEFSKAWGSRSASQSPGDQGGPVFLGPPAQTGAIVGLALGDGSADLYADPVAYRDQIFALSAALQPGAGLSYRTYVHGTGWQAAQRNGAATGPTGTPLEGLQIWTDHAEPQTSATHVCYSVLVAGVWSPQVCDGQLAGQVQTQATIDPPKPIQVVKLDYQVSWTDWPTKYRVYSHASGWGPWYSNNQVAGVFGDTIEAIQIQPQTQVVIVPPGGTGLN